MDTDDPQIEGGAGLAGLAARARGALVLKGFAYLSGAAGSVAAVLLLVLESAVPALMSGAAITYSLRHLAHLHLNYHRHPAASSELLRRLTLVEGMFAAMLSVGAIVRLTVDVPPRAVIAFALVALLGVMVLAGAIVTQLNDEIPRGSEWLRRTSLVSGFEAALQPSGRHFGRPLLRALRAATPIGEVSCYVVVLMIVLAAIVFTEGTRDLARHSETVRTFLHIPQATAAAEPAPRTAAIPTLHPGIPTTMPSPTGKATSPPTYDETCPGRQPPGTGAPEPQRTELLALWLGGVGIDGVGALVAGCAEPAVEEEGQPGTWLTYGRCEGELRSLGISSPGSEPQLLLQRVASFAADYAQHGELIGASPRISVRAGDFQVVRTTRGDYVLARREVSSGSLAQGGGADSCGQLVDGNAPYLVVPPALVQLWIQLDRTGWIWPISDEENPGAFVFITARDRPVVVATATCPSDTACDMRYAGRFLHATNNDADAVDALMQWAKQS